jgi:hypothetical protein
MSRVHLRLTALFTLGVLLTVHASAGETKKGDNKSTIILPKDPKAIVLSYDPGAGGFIRKGEPPYLKIQADGAVTVTSLFDGSKQEAMLTPAQVQELLQFAVKDNDFFNLTEKKIADAISAETPKGTGLAVGGAGTSVIKVEANNKRHEVSYRGGSAYLQAYPKAKALAQYVAIEKRLADLGASLAKGK